MSSVKLKCSSDWIKCFSESKKLHYWYNATTKQSVWQDPMDLFNKVNEASSIHETTVWTRCFSQSKNLPYWYNSVTKESVWQDPNATLTTTVEGDDEKISVKRQKVDSSLSSSSSNTNNAGDSCTAFYFDQPLLAIERERLRRHCHDVLVNENAKYGVMQGHTKTAKSCRIDGMHSGLQGLFARIMWHQLLSNVNTSKSDVGFTYKSQQQQQQQPEYYYRDGVFSAEPVSDEAVLLELIDAGRSREQSLSILNTTLEAMKQANFTLYKIHVSSSTGADGDKQVTVASSVTLQTSCASSSSSSRRQTSFSLHYADKSFNISEPHINKLLRLYRLHTDSNATLETPEFLSRTFCVLARYESLSGNSDGYQMAFPNSGFQWLRDHMKVSIECFASPLNCWNQRIFSVARDTDSYFGSLGNFFLFHGEHAFNNTPIGRISYPDSSIQKEKDDEQVGYTVGGSFEANPPFVASVMDQMAHHIEDILTRYEHSPLSSNKSSSSSSRSSVENSNSNNSSDVNKSTSIEYAPFSFVVIVPAWTDCEGIQIMMNSRFLRPNHQCVLRLEKRKHTYRPGMQHRTNHEEQPSNVDTLIIFLQNDAGAKLWPVTESMMQSLKKMLEDEASAVVVSSNNVKKH